MKFLLDVNALVALLVAEHTFNGRMVGWVNGLIRRKEPNLLTCSITELGFIRIICQPSTFSRSITEAQGILNQAKRGRIVNFRFVGDEVSGDKLPHWVTKPAQVTDGHLLELAKASGAILATLDRGIPGAFLIPV